MRDLKDIFTGKVQNKTNKRVYIKHLSNDLKCIVEGKNKSVFVTFIYNDSTEKKWIFNDKILRGNELWISYDFICIFVCKDKYDFEEYHIIEFKELMENNRIGFNEYMNNKNTNYEFDDIADKYLNRWKIFDNL